VAAHGGKRVGAGRVAGISNRATQAQRDAVAASGLMPLDYMLQIMREGEDEARKLDAAKAAAPYCHPRLSAVELSGEVGVKTHEQWLDELK
jgi:hypothetical protein